MNAFDITCIAMIAGCLVYIGYSFGRRHSDQNAIEAGVAEWQIDPITGETTFVYKTIKEEVK